LTNAEATSHQKTEGHKQDSKGTKIHSPRSSAIALAGSLA
jgi:hypothetical protein